MPNPIRALNLADFAALLDSWQHQRVITAVHIHCTDRPRHADWRGLPSVEAMRRYHMSIGMRDIAQHLTIDPEGVLWTGRPFDAVPASARGHNGSSAQGPFMIEMVGLFDQGKDPFQTPQSDSVYRAVALILNRFGLDEKAVHFHNEFTTAKTCPGNALKLTSFRAEVKKVLTQGPGSFDVALPASLRMDTSSRGRALVNDLHIDNLDADTLDEAVPEDDAALFTQTELARTSTLTGDSGLRQRSTTPEFSTLRGHAINTSKGVLSTQGEMHSSAADLKRLIENYLKPALDVPDARRGFDHIVFYAHGGLVNERSALCHAKTILPWWRKNRVWPIFFIWESGVLQLLLDKPRSLSDGRGIDDAWDKLVELPTQLAARPIWKAIKRNARSCSAPLTEHGLPGGLFEFARLFADLKSVVDAKNIKLHAVGHSTGPILLARFMPLLINSGFEFDSLSFLAPAMRIDDFEDEFMPNIGAGKPIKSLNVYTMNERAEKDDNVGRLYRKSLLYFVRNACEDQTDGRIIGLQEDLFDDPSMTSYFGLQNKKALAANNAANGVHIHFSQHEDQKPNPGTTATEHGAFDNDKATMLSVLEGITGISPAQAAAFPSSEDFRYCRNLDTGTRALLSAAPDAGKCECCCCCHCNDAANASTSSAFDDGFGPDADAADEPSGTGAPDPRRPPGSRTAVSIGINSYAGSPLGGCINDAESWASRLEGHGFSVTRLLDRKATREAMLDSLRKLIADARPGDELVWFYAGHGTQIDDLEGDEIDQFDEALVPIDYQAGNLLTDDDLYIACEQMKGKRDVTLTIITDCCHSGTVTRAAFDARSLPVESTNRFLAMKPEWREQFRRQRSGVRGLSGAVRGEADALPGVVAIAACQDHEVALESAGHGDFTRHAMSVIEGVLARGESNHQFLRAVLRAFGSNRRQNPNLQEPAPGLKKRKFLGGRS